MITRNADYSIQRLRGLSTDTKPTDVPNGSEFREMDTGKDFMFDEASGDWKEQPKKGGGGGGGGVEKRCLFELNDFSTNTNKWRVDNSTGPVKYVLRDGGFIETRFEIPETVIGNAASYLPVLSVGHAIDSWTAENAIHFYLSGKANTTDMVTVIVHSNNQNREINVPAKAGDKMTIRLSSAGVFINGEAYGSTNIQAALEQVTGLASLNIGSVEGNTRFISQYDYVRIGRGS